MNKLILIDDDAILRRAISQSIDWESMGIELCGTAHDAFEGISLITRYEPDVVITDIRMPQISGIELCSIINREYPGIKMILLSGYEEFEYAQRAIENRVFAYLTKPVKNDDLVETVKSALAEKRLERTRQQLLDTGIPLVRSKIFYEAFGCNIPPEKLNSFLQILGVEQWNSCAVAILRLSADDLSCETLNTQASTIIESAASDLALTCDVQLADLGNLCFAVIMFSDCQGDNMSSRMLELGERMSEYFQHKYHLRIYGVISRSYNASPVALHSAYAEANKAAIWSQLKSIDGLVLASDYSSIQPEDENENNECMHQCMKQLAASLLDIDTDWEAVMDSCISIAQDRCISLHIVQINALRFLTLLHDRSSIPFEPSALENDQLFILSQKQLLPVFDRIRNHCSTIRKQMAQARRSRSQVLADKAVAYLHQHYNDPELSLTTIANKLDVSYTYLSQIFNNEVGQRFQIYLQTLRMEKAKELLNYSDLKNYEVAEKVGYSNVYYFGMSFKKYTGMTVTEYKKHIRS